MGSVPETTLQYSYLAGSTGPCLLENYAAIGGIQILSLFPRCPGQKLLKALK